MAMPSTVSHQRSLGDEIGESREVGGMEVPCIQSLVGVALGRIAGKHASEAVDYLKRSGRMGSMSPFSTARRQFSGVSSWTHFAG